MGKNFLLPTVDTTDVIIINIYIKNKVYQNILNYTKKI